MPKFHVETQRTDGTWQTFTVEPIEGEEAARAHMAKMLDGIHPGMFGEGDPSKVRLHELTEEDLVREVIKKLTPEEKEHIVLNHVRKIGSQAFEKHFDDQVETLAASWKLDPSPKLLAKFDPDLSPTS